MKLSFDEAAYLSKDLLHQLFFFILLAKYVLEITRLHFEALKVHNDFLSFVLTTIILEIRKKIL